MIYHKFIEEEEEEERKKSERTVYLSTIKYSLTTFIMTILALAFVFFFVYIYYYIISSPLYLLFLFFFFSPIIVCRRGFVVFRRPHTLHVKYFSSAIHCFAVTNFAR